MPDGTMVAEPISATDNTAIKALIERIERHEDEGADIRVAADALGLDAKKLKAIRKAKADAAAAQKTLDALLAGGLFPAATSTPRARKPRAQDDAQ